MTREVRNSNLPLPRLGIAPVPTPPLPVRFELRNGLRVVAIPRPELPQIAARLLLPAGSVTDPAGSPGTASLSGELLTEGTGGWSALELNERIDRLGASLCARVGHDFAEIDLTLLSETLGEGLELLARVLSDATFPPEDFERVRAEALDALESRADEPANVADDRLALALFGPGHPYARLPLGTLESVQELERDGLVDFYRARYRPQGSTLVIAGDFEISSLAAQLERALAPWTGTVTPTAYPPPLRSPAGPAELLHIGWDGAAQGELRVAGLGMARHDPDWIPASVANYILGGSTITGRLGANLREDKGWTYGVRAAFTAGLHPAGWVIETAVDAAVAFRAIDEILLEVGRMLEEPVSGEEVERAREALILSLPRAFETPARTVARFATVEAFGLGAEYWEHFPARVREVTPEEVMRIAQRFFAPTGLVRVVVGPDGAELDAGATKE